MQNARTTTCVITALSNAEMSCIKAEKIDLFAEKHLDEPFFIALPSRSKTQLANFFIFQSKIDNLS